MSRQIALKDFGVLTSLALCCFVPHPYAQRQKVAPLAVPTFYLEP